MNRTTVLSSSHLLLLATAALVAASGMFGDRARAQQQAAPVRETNYDIRLAPTAEAAAYRNRVERQAQVPAALGSAREAGLERLRTEFAALDVLDSPLTGALEVVGVRAGSGFLTGGGVDRAGAMRGFIAGHADAYGLSQEQVQGLQLVADYTNPAGNMSWVEFEQRINGVPVFQGLVRGGFTRNGELARVTGPLAAGLDPAALRQSAGIEAARAVSLAAAHVGWNVAESSLTAKAVSSDGQRVTFERGAISPMADDAKAWPVYFPLAPGVARLAWATEIWGDPDVYLIVLDAEDGTVLFRKNQTSYQTQAATYNVYNDDSPAPLSPTNVLPGSGTQAPFISRTSVTLVGNEAPNTFNNLGWMTDGLNETDGNNVRAGLDLVSPDGIESTVAGSSRTFNFAYNPQTDDPSTALYRSGEVTDMFYWTNRYHDSLYLLGFTEAARNFQNDNFGRGGVAGDKVRAEGQDFSGTNNANFSTPSDGTSGRMQMYIFTGPTPHRTSAIDHDVLLHELTHGTSNRLHNNATGLASQISAGMGEGWSDFYARALLSTAGEDANGVYTSGGWITYQISGGFADNYYYGIRRFPYAVKTTVGSNGKPHNPLTFADIDPYQINLSDGAFSPAFVGAAFEVHNIGEVWCMALLEVRARFITRLGFATGNQRFLQFVTDGMKMDPVNPTPLSGRDAILAAAAAGGGTAADIADIWAGFAARGMGVQATFNASSFVVGESYNVPGGPLPSFSINDVSIVEGNSGTTNAVFTVSLANSASLASTSRVTWTTADGTATAPGTTFTAAGPITVPASTSGGPSNPGAPYPLNLAVAGLPTSISHLKVRLNSVTHTWLSDVDVLLVGPGGQKVMLMSDAGGFSPGVSGVNLTFEDGAPKMPLISPPASGTYSPTDVESDVFTAPAPAGPYGSALSVFNGTNPNGTWSLYVMDDFPPVDSGTIGGFSLVFSTASTDDYVPSSGTLTFPMGGPASQTISVPIVGDVNAEPNETFFVNLSFASGAGISDSQGVGTILTDEGGGTPPTVVTGSAGNITATAATLFGSVNPNGFATTYNFQYGPTAAYGSTTGTFSAGSGSSPISVGLSVSGLACNTPYHFRITATSSAGTSFGSDATFTTASCAPVATTGIASLIGLTDAMLNGVANPDTVATTARFEWGTTTAYGNMTPPQSIGSGSANVVIGGGAISGLTCNTTYHFRATATNAFGTSMGTDTAFNTPPCTPSSFKGFVYALDSVSTGSNYIFAYGVGASGALTQIPGFPVPTGGLGFGGTLSEELAYDSVNARLYASNDASGTLSAYSVDRATGALTPMPFSPIALGGFAAGYTVQVHPTGSPVTVGTSNGVASFVITPTTATPAAGSPYSTGAASPFSSTFSRDGNYFYAGGNTGTATAAFSVTPATGVLTPLGGSPFDSGATFPVGNATDASGRLFVANYTSNQVRAFTTAGGVPTAVSGNPFTAGGLVAAVAGVVHPSGFYMVADRGGNQVGVYRIAGSGSATTLTGVAGSPFAAGGTFTDALALSKDGSLLVAANGNSRNLTVFGVNSSTGALTSLLVQPVNTLGNAGLITGVAFASSRSAVADFDGDGKTDVGVFRPSTGTWYDLQSSTGYSSYLSIGWGVSTDIPVTADYDGDGKADVAVYRPSSGTWYVLTSSSGYTSYTSTMWGVSTDIPVAADYDGDGKADLAVFRPSNGHWYVLTSSSGYASYTDTAWGTSGDVPVPRDFDGDGKADIAVFRPSTGHWYVLTSSSSYTSYTDTAWGVGTDVQVAGDYDGDGKADLAVFRPSTGTWYILQSSTGYSMYMTIVWGVDTDIPVPGDYDGDGKFDVAVFRPSSGVWYVLTSSSGYTSYTSTTWGVATDVPVIGN